MDGADGIVQLEHSVDDGSESRTQAGLMFIDLLDLRPVNSCQKGLELNELFLVE